MTNAPQTLNDLLARAAGSPDTGLRFVDRRENERFVAWPEVHRRAVGVAGALRASGVARHDRVALIYPTGPEFFDAFFGVLLAGAVPVPLYPPVRLGRLDEYHRRTARMLDLVSARVLLAEPRIRRMLGETVRRARPELGCRTLEGLDTGHAETVDPQPGDLALVQFSSGTTVDPKPVALSHRAVVAQAVLLNRFWPDVDGVRHSGLSWLPLYHDMGLIGCVGPALERPGVLTLLPPEAFVARPALWLRALSRYRSTVSPAPSFAFAMCVNRVRDDELDGVDLEDWRVALNGAETVVPTVVRAFAERFARWGFRPEAMTPVYGLSEAALAVSFSAIDRAPRSVSFDRDRLATEGRAVEQEGGREIVSVGRALPGFDVRVVDEARLTAGESRVGRIEVRGPSLMEGYLDQPQATAEALLDGWLDTGDLGFVADGELYLTGRAKDMLLLRGRCHAPEEVERAVEGIDGARPGCVVAASWLPEGSDGEELLLLVEAMRGTIPERFEEIARACASRVLRVSGLEPDRVEVLRAGTLPRTSSGKLRRQEALRLFLAGELSAPDDVNALHLAKALARSAAAYARVRRS